VTASLLHKKRPRTARGAAAALSAELPCVAKQQGRRPPSRCVNEIQHEAGPSSSTDGEVELGTGDLPRCPAASLHAGADRGRRRGCSGGAGSSARCAV
jgi:hypothetical protein